MNIFTPPTERSDEYKQYYSVFKSIAKQIVPDTSETRFNDWMNNVVAKFPYFVHTNPRVMAIASSLADSGGAFNMGQAKQLIGMIFKEDVPNLIIDVRRYYNRLTT